MLYIALAFVCLIFSIAYSRTYGKTGLKWLKWALAVLFFIWGFEYYNTVDYRVMLQKFNHVVYGDSMFTNSGDDVSVELGCRLLFYLCSPFGNLSYYILVAAFEAYVLWLFIRKYIPARYAWVLFMLMLFQFEYVTVLMTLKRQMLGIFTALLILHVMNEKQGLWSTKKLVLTALGIAILAFNFHKAVIVGVLFIPIWYLARHKVPWQLQVALIGFYLFQYFFNLGAYAFVLEALIGTHDTGFAHYATQIADGGRTTSAIHIAIEFTLYALMVLCVNKCNHVERSIFISGFVYSLLINFFVMDSGRILLPFRLCQMFSIPILLSKLELMRFIRLKTTPALVATALAIISVKSTYEVYTSTEKSSMTEGFKEFDLIFQAPSIQVDNPYSETRKYLPYRLN